MAYSDPAKIKEANRRYRESKKKPPSPKGTPPKPYLCKACGQTDPKKFHKGAKSICKTCESIRRTEKKKWHHGDGASIYFIQIANSDGYIKIGNTIDINHRLRSDGGFTDNPYPLTILLITQKTHRRAELILHRLCSESRVRGEWFYPSESVLNVIGRIKREGVGWLEAIAHPDHVTPLDPQSPF